MAESYDQDKELNRFRGMEVNGFGFDEINECQEVTLSKAIERAGTWLNSDGEPPSLILATCNPTQNWVKAKFYDRWISGTLPNRWAYIPAKITDNPHIPAAYIEGLKANLPPLEYTKFVDGDWEAYDASGRFATYFDEDKHVQPCLLNPVLPLYISFDFNLEPFAFIFYQVHRDGIHIFDEDEVSGGDIFKAVERIRTKYSPRLWSCIITGDYNGNAKDMGVRGGTSHYGQITRELGIQSRQIQTKPNPRHSNSRNDLNYCLYHMQDFRIDPSCKGVIRDLRLVKAEADGSIIKAKRTDIAQRADFLDAVRYAVNHDDVQKWISLKQKSQTGPLIPTPREFSIPSLP